MRAILVVALLGACSAKQQAGPPPADPTPAASQPTANAPVEDIEWDPRTPIEGDIQLRKMFVTAEVASVCPTVALAEANECGNSVESFEDGLRFKRGEQVSIVGDAPVDGFWRAVRYTKLGLLPGWIAAQHVATTPNLTHVDAFRAKHPDALVVTSDQLRVAIEKPPSQSPDYAQPLEPTVFLTHIKGVETALVTDVCFGRQSDDFLPFPFSHHTCLKYADCDVLDYTCKEGAYCDEVLFVLEDREPFEVLGKLVPAKTVKALADRVDVFIHVEGCQR